MTAPLLHDVVPELEAELIELLTAAGELALAERVKHLAIFERCPCSNRFCSSFYTIRNRTTPFPKGFRTLALRPGELHLDVLGSTILHVEVLYRDDLRAKIHAAMPWLSGYDRSDGPGAGQAGSLTSKQDRSLQHSIVVETDKSKNDDFAEIIVHQGGLVIALADGATGLGFGDVAARTFIECIRNRVRPENVVSGRTNLVEELADIDTLIAADCVDADTTGIVAILCDGSIMGCSAGDSEAWLWKDGKRTELTFAQKRKPRLGSGRARPVSFGPQSMAGATLLIGSDGLFNFLDWQSIEAVLATVAPRDAAAALLDAVRTANGGYLQDDFSAVVVGAI